jgi:hypothetical protein
MCKLILAFRQAHGNNQQKNKKKKKKNHVTATVFFCVSELQLELIDRFLFERFIPSKIKILSQLIRLDQLEMYERCLILEVFYSKCFHIYCTICFGWVWPLSICFLMGFFYCILFYNLYYSLDFLFQQQHAKSSLDSMER